MKTIFITYIISLISTGLLITSSCSSQVSEPANTDSSFSIKHEKDILFDLQSTLNGNPVLKIDSFLILLDRGTDELVGINHNSGKEIWRIGPGVRRYFIYKRFLIVQTFDAVVACEVEEGYELWNVKAVLDHDYKSCSTLAEEVLTYTDGGHSILNLKTNFLEPIDYKPTLAHYFRIEKDHVVRELRIAEEKLGGGDLLETVIVEDTNGNLRNWYWRYFEDRNLFALDGSPVSVGKGIDHFWNLDRSDCYPSKDSTMELYNGFPGRDKLATSVHLVNGQLFFYENYTGYRWSWEMGNNRVTCVNWKNGELNYQLWGQKCDQPYQRFHFFDNYILQSNNTMHVQEKVGTFFKFDEQKGIVGDSLSQTTNYFMEYGRDHLIGFSYDHYQTKKENGSLKHHNTIEMVIWNHEKNEYSEIFCFELGSNFPYWPSVFVEDNLIVLNFYDDELKKRVLRCYNILKNEN